MNHIYPMVKGDQLCPLGFHPQVRWPTRCKRCFRDYKEHGNKRGLEDVTSSSPSISERFTSPANFDQPVRSWTSTQNLSSLANNEPQQVTTHRLTLPKRPASWASTPDLEQEKPDVTVNVKIPPRRRLTVHLDGIETVETVTIKPPKSPTKSVGPGPNELKMDSTPEIKAAEPPLVSITQSDSLAERVRKMQILKRQGSWEKEGSREREPEEEKSAEKKPEPRKRLVNAATDTVSKQKPADLPVKPPVTPSKPAEAPKATAEDTATPTVRRRRPTPAVTESPLASPKVLPKVAEAEKPRIRRRETTTSSSSSDDSSQGSPASLKKLEKTSNNANSSDIQFLMQVKDSAKTKPKKSVTDDTISNCTETTDTTLVDTREMQEELESLKRELESWKTRCERAERDKSDIMLRRISAMDTGTNRTAASEVLKLQQKVNEMKSEIEDLKDEKKILAAKVKEVECDLDARPSKSVEEMLRAKLEQAEALCEELMDENEDMKKEIRNMEAEMDEMHDNFREDQADEYSRLKRELEQTTKNCRILSFKLKKCDRRIEQLEGEKQALDGQGGTELLAKINKLEEELRVANEVARRLQIENEKGGETKRAPSLGNIGKSTSADSAGKVKRASLMRGGSQEDPVQLLRDLQDSIEREHDIREQLKYAEEEAETLRAKVSRIEDENESLVMQLKKMANKAKNSRKPSPNPPTRRGVLEPPVERDEGIDEEDPAELRLQLELNEQETVVLRRRLEELEKETSQSKQQIKVLEEKLESKTKELAAKPKATRPRSTDSALKDPLNDKKIQVMEDEINELRKKVIEKDRDLERLENELSLSKKPKLAAKSKDMNVTEQQNLDFKRQLQLVEQEASVLRSKTQKMEAENEKLNTEVKKLQLQVARAKASSNNKLNEIGSDPKTKETLEKLEKEKNELQAKLKTILEEATEKLPARTPKKYSESLTKLQLKKMLEELEEEIAENRAIIAKSGGDKIKTLEADKVKAENELKEAEKRYEAAQKEIRLLKSKTDTENVSTSKVRDELRTEKEKVLKLEKELEKEKKEKTKLDTKVTELETQIHALKKAADRSKAEHEKELNYLKSRSMTAEVPSKKMQELKDHVKELEEKLGAEQKRYETLQKKIEGLEEEHIIEKSHLITDKENLEFDLRNIRMKINELQANETLLKRENDDLNRRIHEQQKTMNTRSGREAQLSAMDAEKTRYKNLMEQAQHELETKNRENEMNREMLSQVRREADELRKRLEDFERIDKSHRTLGDHNSALEKEMKSLKQQLETAEIQSKSEVAATRLRYEQQANHLQTEMKTLQHQCERFKRDRDTFKQLLEGAQKTISDLKQNRKSIASISSSGDEDEKTKIAILEQQIGCLEDELSEARLETGKLRTELVSEKSNADVKISELTSKLNEYEEEKLLGSGRTRLSSTKTKLELSWQKEREEQQRLVQETATLARDLRQTLFEVERERDKERLESKRKIEQIRKMTEEELEDGRKKISELQSDLLELRDVHAKLRTANEKLRRDRDRYEKEALKRKLEHDGERKVGALLQTVDELVKIAPDIQIKTDKRSASSSSNNNLPIPSSRVSKSRTPSPQRQQKQVAFSDEQLDITNILARLAEASEELRRYQRIADEDKIRERARRSGMRRAASTEGDDKQSPIVGRRLGSGLNRNGSLQKKSLSLDQSMNKDQLIWKQDSVDDSMSSMQSIDSEFGESRFSDVSVASDLPRHRKKKRGLISKLRSKLSSGRGSDSEMSRHGSDSDLSLGGDIASSKKDLSKRISGIFKRSGSSSRGNSIEKTLPPSGSNNGNGVSQQRPISVPTGSATQLNEKHLSKSAKPPMPLSGSQTQLRKRVSK
ncbi:titin homolog isoform X2 [Culicoides brevitarsis]|uniref:titin homolog isoform X2 n=1 Tax=Culicoides brevitarsis TaxID=469753 RepID=UPI00307CB5B5